jgi:hypothetical protein
MTAIHRKIIVVRKTGAIALHTVLDGEELSAEKGADKITCIVSTFPTRVWHMFGIVYYSSSLRVGASYKPAAMGNLEQPVLPYHPSTESSSIGRSQLYVKTNSHAISITNKVSNTSTAKMRAPHQISLPYSSTAFAPPPSPSRLWVSSIPIYRRSEGFPMASNHRRTRTNRTERSRRMSFIA